MAVISVHDMFSFVQSSGKHQVGDRDRVPAVESV